MKRLGEILLDWGALAVSELHTGLEACNRTGGRLGTQLLKFGFVEEHQLLDALAEQYGVKSVAAVTLDRTRKEILGLIPIAHARRLQAIPFELEERQLFVAMTNPRDPVAVEEIGEMTGMAVTPYVATEAAVMGVINRVDGGDEDDLGGSPEGQIATEWDALWSPSRVLPTQLLNLRRRAPVRPAEPPRVATFPGLAPFEGGQDLEADHELDEGTYRELLSTVDHRDAVGRLVLRYAASFFGRLCLFAVHRGSIVGWMARGHGVVLDDVQSFSVLIDEETLFHEFRFGAGYHLGPIPLGGENDALIRLLGDPPPLGALLLPIRIKDRAVAFVLGDNPNEEIVAIPVDEVAAAVGVAGLALEVLILRKKILG